MKPINKLILLSLAAVTLQGCSVGQDDFNCSSGDDNAICGSTRSIYTATNGALAENTKLTYIANGEVHQTDVANINELKGSLESSTNQEQRKLRSNRDKNKTSKHKKRSKNEIQPVKDPVILEKSTNQLLFEVSQLGGATSVGDIVRTKAKVMKIGINNWTDREDLFHMASIILTDIEKRRWDTQSEFPEAPSDYVVPFKPTEKVDSPVKIKSNANGNAVKVKSKN